MDSHSTMTPNHSQRGNLLPIIDLFYLPISCKVLLMQLSSGSELDRDQLKQSLSYIMDVLQSFPVQRTSIRYKQSHTQTHTHTHAKHISIYNHDILLLCVTLKVSCQKLQTGNFRCQSKTYITYKSQLWKVLHLLIHIDLRIDLHIDLRMMYSCSF